MKLHLQLARTTIWGIAFLACVLTGPVCADPPKYVIEDLGALWPGGNSHGWALNEAGQVAGNSADVMGDGRWHAFLYSEGVMHDLGTLGGTNSRANGINNLGQLTGTSDTLPSGNSAFIYSNGVMEDIGTLGGAVPVSSGESINDAGEVTGTSFADQARVAFLYSDGVMRPLELVPEACESGASIGFDINNSGQVTGDVATMVGDRCGRSNAFIYSDGRMRLIAQSLSMHTVGNAINDSGQVAVYAYGSGRRSAGYIYTDGNLEKIDVPPDEFLSPWDINNSGWVVGNTSAGGSSSPAFLYIDGQLLNLGDLIINLSGWEELTVARSINDRGQILGNGRVLGGLARAFLLTRVSIEATIDIRPRSSKNKVNLRSEGNIPVAIFSTLSFDATQVDWETVTFGPANATETHGRIHVRDLDKDGDVDSVLHFNIRQTGIECGDEEATIVGETFAGDVLAGSDEIKTVKCG